MGISRNTNVWNRQEFYLKLWGHLRHRHEILVSVILFRVCLGRGHWRWKLWGGVLIWKLFWYCIFLSRRGPRDNYFLFLFHYLNLLLPTKEWNHATLYQMYCLMVVHYRLQPPQQHLLQVWFIILAVLLELMSRVLFLSSSNFPYSANLK